MRNKILILMIVTLIIGGLNVHAQSRVDDVKFKFAAKSEKFTKAYGWKKNKESGKWVRNRKVISDKKVNNYNYYQKSRYGQNFEWLQIAKIINNEKTYYILIYEYFTGHYVYEYIQEKWTFSQNTYYIVYNPEQYEELKRKIDLKTGENFKIYGTRYKHLINDYSSRLKSMSDKKLLGNITSSINSKTYFYPGSPSFILNSQTFEGKDILRFRLPHNSESNIDKEYFEAKLSDFKKILID